MANPREEITHSLQGVIDEWETTEYPKLQAFQEKLHWSSVMLRQGQMSEKDCFLGLMEQDYSGEVGFTVRWEQAYPESEMNYIIQKTPDGKLKVKIGQQDYLTFSVPSFTATIGLSEEGQMQVEQIEATGINEDTGKIDVYEDDSFLLSDVITAVGASTTTKTEQGEILKEALFCVSPFLG